MTLQIPSQLLQNNKVTELIMKHRSGLKVSIILRQLLRNNKVTELIMKLRSGLKNSVIPNQIL